MERMKTARERETESTSDYTSEEEFRIDDRDPLPPGVTEHDEHGNPWIV